MIEELLFIEELSRQIYIRIVNLGNKDCTMKDTVSIRPLERPRWTETPVVWTPALLPPDGSSKGVLNYKWTNNVAYLINVKTENDQPIMAFGRAP